jgi:hypothetical protein
MLNGKQVARKWMNGLKKWMKRKAVRGAAFSKVTVIREKRAVSFEK